MSRTERRLGSGVILRIDGGENERSRADSWPHRWVSTSVHALMTLEAHVASGEQLETVHLQRQRAQAAYDLIDYYTQFSRDDTSRIDGLRKEGKEGRRQVATLLRRLATLAKEIDLPTADKVGDTSLSLEYVSAADIQ
jgi:hypothetical protein